MKLTKKMNDSATLVDVAITTGEKTVSKTCDPATIDSMISELVQLRAEMRPAKKVGMNPEQSRFYECDNLLWDTHCHCTLINQNCL